MTEFEFQPTLTGERVLLRPLRADEFETLYAVAADPLIWAQHPSPDRHRREVFQGFFDGAIASGGAFAVIEVATGRVIGSSRYWNLRPAASEVEIGFTFLSRDCWGGRHNGEMKALMLRHAFRFVERVVFVIGEGNARSRRSVERIGARFLGSDRRPGSDGKPQEIVTYLIEKKDFR